MAIPFTEDDIALQLNSSNAYVNLGNPDTLNFSGSITLQAWIKPTATDGLRDIVAHGYSSSPAGEVYLRIANGQYQVGSWNGADHFTTAAMPPGDLGRWVHLCGVYDGSAWVIYSNGTPMARTRRQHRRREGRTPPGPSAPKAAAASAILPGQIRNVAIWKTARTSDQIAQDMRDPGPRRRSRPGRLLAAERGRGDHRRGLQPERAQRHL